MHGLGAHHAERGGQSARNRVLASDVHRKRPPNHSPSAPPPARFYTPGNPVPHNRASLFRHMAGISKSASYPYWSGGALSLLPGGRRAVAEAPVGASTQRAGASGGAAAILDSRRNKLQ